MSLAENSEASFAVTVKYEPCPDSVHGIILFFVSPQAPSVMAFPATTPTGMMAYAMVSQLGLCVSESSLPVTHTHSHSHHVFIHAVFLLLQPPHMGSMMMTQPTMMYTQPVMKPANPFGGNPGAQVKMSRHPAQPSTHSVTSQTFVFINAVVHFHLCPRFISL